MADASQLIWSSPVDGGQTRLFCFPFAGAGASVFVGWRRFGDATAVCPVQLPGRENRLRESAFDRIEPLVNNLADAFTDFVDAPYAFYGHSMGGVIAYELCHEFRRRGMPLPCVLFVGASRAPQFSNPNPPIAHLSDDDFIAALDRRYGGLPDAVLKRPELLQLFLPTLRSDFGLLENYQWSKRALLDVPIVSFGGTNDGSISKKELNGWREHTSGAFELRFLEGDHFFAKSSAESVMNAVNSRLGVGDRR